MPRPAPHNLAPLARPTSPRPAHRARGGFSFVEVLFAVMILGLGFIMIAGIFPVAINQAQSTDDESVAAAVGRNAVEYMAKLPKTASFSPDNVVHPLDGPWWDTVKGNLILPEDPRYAWVGFFRRPATGSQSGTAQVIAIAVRARNKAAYVPDTGAGGDLALYGSPQRSNLMGKPVKVSLSPQGGDAPDQVTFSSAGGTDFTGAVAPRCYVVIAADSNANPGNANGWVLRVGNQLNGNTWELLAGNDLKSSAYKPSQADAFIVGQGPDPDTGAFSGGAQDVAVYTSFIQLRS